MVLVTACEKLVEVNAPDTSTTETNVYNNDATAVAVLTSIYTKMSLADPLNGGITSLSLFPGLSADEFTLSNNVNRPVYLAYYTNSLNSVNIALVDYWNDIYQRVFVANAAIEGLSNSSSLTPAIKLQLLGEAKFVRAFFYFYLVNLYGEVPLVTSTDYTVTPSLSRAPVAQVWQQIIADLHEAQQLMKDNFLDITLLNTTAERVRPTKWAATALLARSYLYTGNWAGADSASTAVISQAGKFELTALNDVFLANSPEAIWQLQPVNADINTRDAQLFILPSSGPDNDHPVYLSNDLVNSFEPADKRRTDWIKDLSVPGLGTFPQPFKYKVATAGAPVTEYSMVLRLAEQYLIRAEAATQQGNIAKATADLNVIRNRAGLPNTTVADKTGLLTAILYERQVELFSEWGHRWLDLKRTRKVNPVMSTAAAVKGGTWSPFKQLYPISITEIQNGVNLKQNEGY